MIDLNKKTWQFATLATLAIIWGSSFILMKRGMETFTDMEVAALRVFIAFLVLLPISIPNLKHLKGKFLFPLICSGILGNALPAFLFTKAQTVIPSSLSGMLNSLTPLLTLLAGVLFFGIKTNRMNVAGVLIGLIGAMGLLFNGRAAFVNAEILHGSLVILATLCYAFSVNIIKIYLRDLNAAIITSVALFIVGPFCGIYLFSTDFLSSFGKENAFTNFGYIVLLGVIGTSVSVIIFNFLIKKTSAVFASSVTYFIPVVAIAWGTFDGEVISLMQVLWIAVILSGVYMVNMKYRKSV